MITLDELLLAPLLPKNLPTFEIIKECQLAQNSVVDSDSDENSGEETEEEEEEDIEEVFPCECGYDENSNNFEAQACGPLANCINRELFIECNVEECPCRDRCQNQNFQKRKYAKVKVIETEGKGFGLFTCEDLRPGTLVMEYVGEIVTQDQMNHRAELYAAQGQPHFYFMTLRPNKIIDATCKGNLSRFLNHSCAPNCETQKWIVGGRIKIGLFTLKSIKCGTELTFDYKFVRFGKDPQRCLCGEPNCTGFIGVSESKTKSKKSKIKKEQNYLSDDGSEEFDEDDIEDLEKLLKLEEAETPDQIALIVKKLINSTDDLEIIYKLLNFLGNTKKYLCQRKFLNLHGMKILGTIFTEHSNDQKLVEHILKILKELPLTSRNSIEDSGWFEKLKMISESFSEFELIVKELVKKWQGLEMIFKIPRKKEIQKSSSEPLSPTISTNTNQNINMNNRSTMMSVPLEFSSALQRKRQWTGDEGDQQQRKESEFSRSTRSTRSTRSKSPVKIKSEDSIDPMWLTAKTADGKIYYYHSVTRETSWELPMTSTNKEINRDDRYRDKERYRENSNYDRHRESDSHRNDYSNRGREREINRNRDYRDTRDYSDYRDTKNLRDSDSGKDYRDTVTYNRDNRDTVTYNIDNRASTYNRSKSRERIDNFSKVNTVVDTINNNNNQSINNRNSALLEGVRDSGQLAAIIERAKARRTQEENEVRDGKEIESSSSLAAIKNIKSSKSLSSPNSYFSPTDNLNQKKINYKLREEISGLVVRFFSHYRQDLGKEFKELARKYTQKIIEKELKEKESSVSGSGADELLLLTSKKRLKIKNYLAEVIKGRKIKLLPEHEPK